jgi:hypothetical protein
LLSGVSGLSFDEEEAEEAAEDRLPVNRRIEWAGERLSSDPGVVSSSGVDDRGEGLLSASSA